MASNNEDPMEGEDQGRYLINHCTREVKQDILWFEDLGALDYDEMIRDGLLEEVRKEDGSWVSY